MIRKFLIKIFDLESVAKIYGFFNKKPTLNVEKNKS